MQLAFCGDYSISLQKIQIKQPKEAERWEKKMKEYSNLAEINTETIPNTVISDLASLLYEVFCEKKQSQEKTA